MLKNEYVKNDAWVSVVSADLGIRKVEAFCFPQLVYIMVDSQQVFIDSGGFFCLMTVLWWPQFGEFDR